MSTVVKLAEKAKPSKPTKAAIKALKADPSLAPDFDARYGPGSAALHLQGTTELAELLGDLLEGQAELCARIEELIEVVKAPRHVYMDTDGDVAGAVSVTKFRLDEGAKTWVCNECDKPTDDCTCDAGGELLNAP